MVLKKSKEKKPEKTSVAAEPAAGAGSSSKGGVKTWMPWLPFVSWIVGTVIVTFLVFFFYGLSLSPTITAAYFVIVLLGSYILWRSRKFTCVKSKDQKKQ